MQYSNKAQTKIVSKFNEEAPIIGISKEHTFDYFFRKYYAMLCFFARSIIHNEEEAKDIVQECFYNLWISESIDERKDSIKSFLYTMVRNSCFTFLRRRAVIAKSITYLKSSEDNVEYFDEIAFAEMVRLVLRQIDELSPRMNMIIKKYYLEGKRHKEIAIELSSTENAIRMHKKRVIKLLRKMLQILNSLTA